MILVTCLLIGVFYLLFKITVVCFKMLFKVTCYLITWSMTLAGVIIALCAAFLVGLFHKNPTVQLFFREFIIFITMI